MPSSGKMDMEKCKMQIKDMVMSTMGEAQAPAGMKMVYGKWRKVGAYTPFTPSRKEWNHLKRITGHFTPEGQRKARTTYLKWRKQGQTHNDIIGHMQGEKYQRGKISSDRYGKHSSQQGVPAGMIRLNNGSVVKKSHWYRRLKRPSLAKQQRLGWNT